MAKIEYMTNAFQSDLKPRARLVLNCLALHCNKEGQCFPSIKTIAKECGYSVNTVKRALDDLVKAGFITKEARFDTERKHGGQTSNLYTLNIVKPKKEESKPSDLDREQPKQVDENGNVKKELEQREKYVTIVSWGQAILSKISQLRGLFLTWHIRLITFHGLGGSPKVHPLEIYR